MSAETLTRGMDMFLEELQEYADMMTDDKIADVLMVGGEALAEDVRKLPKPRRVASRAAHMLDSVRAEKKAPKVEVGWGLYYGMFVEHGTTKMSAQPHLIPTWNKNQERYSNLMVQKLFEKG